MLRNCVQFESTSGYKTGFNEELKLRITTKFATRKKILSSFDAGAIKAD